MIRGPVPPNSRDSMWEFVAANLQRFESGLTLVVESLDCSSGELGCVDGLARDAMGGAVLLLLATDGDALLPARALAAGEFLERVGDSISSAIPEARFCADAPSRVLLIGTEGMRVMVEYVAGLPIARLQACTVDPFRVGGAERFAIRWIDCERSGYQTPVAPAAGEAAARALEFQPPPERAELWATVRRMCGRIDGAVRIGGDRFSRRITWQGRLLGEVRTSDGSLVGYSANGVIRELCEARDVRRFGDQLLRTYARAAGLVFEVEDTSNGYDACEEPSTDGGADRGNDTAAARHAVGERGGVGNGAAAAESLRSSVAASRLTAEEFSALGDSASSAGHVAEGSVAEDRS